MQKLGLQVDWSSQAPKGVYRLTYVHIYMGGPSPTRRGVPLRSIMQTVHAMNTNQLLVYGTPGHVNTTGLRSF